MMDLGKIRKALDVALREHNDLMLQADLPTGSKIIEEAIAELEKPAKEDVSMSAMVYNIALSFCGAHSPGEYVIAEKHAINLIQQYAESCHAKKCAECKHTVWCSFCGDPITIGVCENCAPDMFNDDNTPKTEEPNA